MIRQLLRKELRLQRSSLAFAVAVVAVWGVLMALTMQGSRVLFAPDFTMAQLAAMLQSFFVGSCLLGIIPLFVGAATVAEERKLGVWDWQLSLPASRAMQWLVKLGVGAAIVLVLSCGVQPTLDALLTLALGGPTNMNDRCPLPSFLLGMNAGYYLLPLLLMVSGAFVSSLVADPYKAFFGGMVAFAVVGGCVLIADPAFLMFRPWEPSLHVSQAYPVMQNLAPLLVVGLSAVVAWMAWFNFRFEALRWRRLAGEVLGMAVLSCLLTAAFLYGEFSPRWLLSQDRRDVEPIIAGERPNYYPLEQPKVDWTGIEPLLVKRLHTGSFGDEAWKSLFANRYPLGHLYRLSGSDRLLVELNSVPLAVAKEGGWGNYRFSEVGYQLAEIQMGSKEIRAIPSQWGHIEGALPGTSAYLVEGYTGARYAVTAWPVPIQVEGVLWEVGKRALAIGSPLRATTIGAIAEANRWPQVSNADLGLDGKNLKMESTREIGASYGFYETRIVSEDKKETWWLIRDTGKGKWTVLDKKAGPVSYAVSSDGKWYAENGRLRRPWWHGADALTVFSVDGQTSWTLASPDGNLHLTGDDPQRFAGGPGLRELGMDNDRNMPVSPSGRFLAFARTKAFQAVDEGGTMRITKFPESVEVGVLDLQTGQECMLMHQTPDHAARAAFKEAMSGWLWAKWTGEGGEPLAEMWGELLQVPSFDRYAESSSSYRAVSPPMAWAPGEDKLAVHYDGVLHVFAYLPEAAQRLREIHGTGRGSRGDFLPVGMADLTGFQIDHLDFWDAKTLLVWGRLGLFRVDLEEATRPRDPGEPRR